MKRVVKKRRSRATNEEKRNDRERKKKQCKNERNKSRLIEEDVWKMLEQQLESDLLFPASTASALPVSFPSGSHGAFTPPPISNISARNCRRSFIHWKTTVYEMNWFKWLVACRDFLGNSLSFSTTTTTTTTKKKREFRKGNEKETKFWNEWTIGGFESKLASSVDDNDDGGATAQKWRSRRSRRASPSVTAAFQRKTSGDGHVSVAHPQSAVTSQPLIQFHSLNTAQSAD